jgi:transposase
MYRRGDSKSAIARALSIDRKTVRKYLMADDFSPPAPSTKQSNSIIEAYQTVIDEWLEADRFTFHKQRHTAKRVFDRLRAEQGYIGSYREHEGTVLLCSAGLAGNAKGNPG